MRAELKHRSRDQSPGRSGEGADVIILWCPLGSWPVRVTLVTRMRGLAVRRARQGSYTDTAATTSPQVTDGGRPEIKSRPLGTRPQSMRGRFSPLTSYKP